MRNHFTNKTFRSSIGQLAQYSIIDLSLCFLDNVLMGNRFANNQGVINLANNFTCGRNSVMGNIVTYASPYLYPFVVEYSLIGAAVVFAMWRSIGSNPRYYSPSSLPKNKQTKRGYSFWTLNFFKGKLLLINLFWEHWRATRFPNSQPITKKHCLAVLCILIGWDFGKPVLLYSLKTYGVAD